MRKELADLGIPSTVILDSAVGYDLFFSILLFFALILFIIFIQAFLVLKKELS